MKKIQEKVLVLLLCSSSKILAKWQEPFVVTWCRGGVNYEVVRADRGGERLSLFLWCLRREELKPKVPKSTKPDFVKPISLGRSLLTCSPFEWAAMLEIGVIDDFICAWRSTIHLLVRKDGSTRFCVDYRRINNVPLHVSSQHWIELRATGRFLSPESRGKKKDLLLFYLYQFTKLSSGLFGASHLQRPRGPGSVSTRDICYSLFG